MLPEFELVTDTKFESEKAHNSKKVWANTEFFKKKGDVPLINSTMLVCEMGEPDKTDDRLRTVWFTERIERIKKEGFEVLGIYKLQSIGKTPSFKDSIQYAIEVWNQDQNKSPVDVIQGCVKY
jgi:hypothetical protein